jgi:hypothetical protein
MRETEFILFYFTFVSFLIFIIEMGAPSFLPPDAMQEYYEIKAPVYITTPSYVESFPCEGWGIFQPICNALYGFIRVLWNIAVAIYWFFKFIIDGIKIFILLLKFSSPIRWVGAILTVMTIVLFYTILRLIRGGG